MRVTVPNPFGPPITFDTAYASSLSFPSLGSQSRTANSPRVGFRVPGLSRRPQARLLSLLVLLVIIWTWYPTPPFPPTYRQEWKMERQGRGGEGYAEGKAGRYVK